MTTYADDHSTLGPAGINIDPADVDLPPTQTMHITARPEVS